MKLLLTFSMLLIAALTLHAQTDTLELRVENIQIELLQTPTNPAFLVMGTSPTEIAAPGSAPAFYTSIQNVSNDFSAFPNNYGFSISPFWWSKRAKELSFEEDFKEENTLTFWKTTTLSAAIVSGVGSNPDLWRYAIGFKSTLLRGRANPTHKKEFLDELRAYHETYYGDINDFLSSHNPHERLRDDIQTLRENVRQIDQQLATGSITQEMAQIQKQEIIQELGEKNNRLDSLRTALSLEFNQKQQYIQSTKAIDEKLNMLQKREGLKWDIGGGMALNSTNNQIDQTQLYRLGVWSNAGGAILGDASQNVQLSGFGLVRFLYFNELIYLHQETASTIPNLGTFDLGGKLQLEAYEKFSFGMEWIYRTALSNDFYKNTYKINGLLQYTFDNKSIYASFGNVINESTDQGPEELMVTFGCNIGIGGNIDLKGIRLD